MRSNNRAPHGSVADKAPYEALTGLPLDPSDEHPFVCVAFSHIPKEKQRKSDLSQPRADKGHFLGHVPDTKGYYILTNPGNNVRISRDVVFWENDFEDIDVGLELPMASPAGQVKVETGQDLDEPISTRSPETHQEKSLERPIRNKRLPVRYRDNFATASIAQVLMAAAEPDLKGHANAMESDKAKEWQAAEDEELETLQDAKTWEIAEVPEKAHVLNSNRPLLSSTCSRRTSTSAKP